MEQRFKTSVQDIDLLPLREFIERDGDQSIKTIESGKVDSFSGKSAKRT